MVLEKGVIEFEWNEGNINKNWTKHHVTTEEAEQAFYDEYKVTSLDILHSQAEHRYILIGKTKVDRLLYIVYTIRGEKIRVISARDTSRKEEKLYEETT